VGLVVPYGTLGSERVMGFLVELAKWPPRSEVALGLDSG